MLHIVVLSLSLDGLFNLGLKFSPHGGEVERPNPCRRDLVIVLILGVFISFRDFSIQALKWTHPSCLMDAVIVCVLCHNQPVRPVILLIVDMIPEILLQRLILTLRLPIRLRMKSNTAQRNSEMVTELRPVFRGE